MRGPASRPVSARSSTGLSGAATSAPNRVPARIHIDSFQQLCDLLGTDTDVRALEHLLSQAATPGGCTSAKWTSRVST
jgi:hypothetical protein